MKTLHSTLTQDAMSVFVSVLNSLAISFGRCVQEVSEMLHLFNSFEAV